MGHLDLEQNVVVEGALTSPTTDTAGWLDNLVSTLASGKIAPWHAEGVRLRLKEISFDLLMGAIERARPNMYRLDRDRLV